MFFSRNKPKLPKMVEVGKAKVTLILKSGKEETLDLEGCLIKDIVVTAAYRAARYIYQSFESRCFWIHGECLNSDEVIKASFIHWPYQIEVK